MPTDVARRTLMQSGAAVAASFVGPPALAQTPSLHGRTETDDLGRQAAALRPDQDQGPL